MDFLHKCVSTKLSIHTGQRLFVQYRSISAPFNVRKWLIVVLGTQDQQATRQQHCRDVCQILEQYDHYNIQYRGFEP